jgi:hypothetical protein
VQAVICQFPRRLKRKPLAAWQIEIVISIREATMRIEAISGTVISAIGVVLLIASNFVYYNRTKDPHYDRRFWLGKDLLTSGEYLLNRLGFWLAIAGIALMILFGVAFR